MSLKEKLWAGKCALPDHLKEKLHNDWFWIFKKIPRAFSAYGPRCPGHGCTHCGGKRKLPWPPRLVEGFDVTRWEFCDEQTAVDNSRRKEIYIPDFKNRRIDESIYNQPWTGINQYGGQMTVWLDKEGWGPSIIPTTSEEGWMKLDPGFQCGWKTTGWNKFYWRTGFRPDFVDMYYNKSNFYIGRNPE